MLGRFGHQWYYDYGDIPLPEKKKENVRVETKIDLDANKDWRWSYKKKPKEVIHQFLKDINDSPSDSFAKLLKT